jgi:hypothetical protein
MASSPSATERAERQARIEEDIRRLFARYRRKPESTDRPVRRFVRDAGAQRPSESAPPRPRA